MAWQLKGQGAANLVFAYCGDDPKLRGQVLRVRKAAAHSVSVIDETIWSGVLDMSKGDAVQHDVSYIRDLMAPLLGRHYVFPGEFMPVPAGLRHLLGEAGGRDDALALLLPDHTTFQANAVVGFTAVGPAVCLEIKPKWGLRPGAQTPAAQTSGSAYSPGGVAAALAGDQAEAAACPAALASAAPAQAARQSGDAEASTTSCGSSSSASRCRAAATAALSANLVERAVGGCRCAAACPPTGGNGTATPRQDQDQGQDEDVRAQPGGSPDPGQLYPRFMLHMLLKHVKDGVPWSCYNPLDLFSGDLGRMRRALRCLLESPSNNLRIFKDGAPLYGTGYAVAAAAAAAAVASEEARPTPADTVSSAAATPQSHGPLQQLAWELRELAPAGAGGASESAAEGAAEQPKSERAVGNSQTLEVLMEVAALALQKEGVMARLHGAQALDDLGPQRAGELYRQLEGALEAAELRPPSRSTSAPTSEMAAAAALQASAEAAVSAAAPAPAAGGNAVAAEATPSAAAAAAAAPSSTSECWACRLAALRRYLMSATAKDCGVMVTMQRAVPTAPPTHNAPGPHSSASEPSPCANPLTAGNGHPPPDAPSADGAAAAAAVDGRPWTGLLRHPCSGQSYLYKVAFVDLDVKAASKIPHHVALDRKLAACAREHGPLLAELAARSGWR